MHRDVRTARRTVLKSIRREFEDQSQQCLPVMDRLETWYCCVSFVDCSFQVLEW